MVLPALSHAPNLRVTIQEGDVRDSKARERVLAKIAKGALDPHCPDCGKRGGKCAKVTACVERRRKLTIRYLDRPEGFGRGIGFTESEYDYVMKRGRYALAS